MFRGAVFPNTVYIIVLAYLLTLLAYPHFSIPSAVYVISYLIML